MTMCSTGWSLAISVLILEFMMISAFSPVHGQPVRQLGQNRLPEYSLYQNEGGHETQPNWLSIQLVGSRPIDQNAIGAKVFLTTTDGRTEMQEVSATSMTAEGPLLHFEMGQAIPEQVRVVWPDGHVQVFVDVPLNQIWVIEYDDTNTLSWERIIGLGALIAAFVLMLLMTMWNQSANDFSKIFSWRK